MLKHIRASHINEIQENKSKKDEEKGSVITEKINKNEYDNNSTRVFGIKPQ